MTNEELVQQIQQGINTVDNLTLLYKQNEYYIYKIARKYSGYIELDDLMQEGYIGMYEAVKRYEGDQEVKFITYAAYWIRNAMECCIERQGYTVRHSRDMKQKINRYNKLVNVFELQYGRKPTDEELCKGLGIGLESLDNLKEYIYSFYNLSSLDIAVQDEDNDTTIGETVADNQDIEKEVLDRIMDQERKSIWGIVEKHTSEYENKVIKLRYLNNMTMRAVGELLGVSGQAIRQVEVSGLRKLRRPSLRKMLQNKYDIVESMAYRGSVSSFNYTWTSSTERAALKLIEKS
ncbi:sigma-70 family RNA polymerase sigma factor [Clostridium sp. Marseille-P299]|uniref:sigma-70 family RNA polymerase sigma factor n=1 Tax=Clostridium sp. Marseille-P299 TaxID=1805477 RepID=UPI00082E385E|nr:sigma-70 family RNA polymerase sigma factor [Clostridium sp. Marseille-P299]